MRPTPPTTPRNVAAATPLAIISPAPSTSATKCPQTTGAASMDAAPELASWASSPNATPRTVATALPETRTPSSMGMVTRNSIGTVGRIPSIQSTSRCSTSVLPSAVTLREGSTSSSADTDTACSPNAMMTFPSPLRTTSVNSPTSKRSTTTRPEPSPV